MSSVIQPSGPTYVRILTTLGHVDHGKTTLMDVLLASNNIISSRMAGKMRYLDSREDEQERGITMESSAVSLKYQVMERNEQGGSSPKAYIINMIDTPGHVDFSTEVSTAARLVDGALVLVDVVEGVCTQTIAVLRQAWQDRLKPILVINKFDRLITELKLAPTEAYHHLARLIEQVNAVMGDFFASERMEDDLRWREERERRLAEKKDQQADEADAHANDDNEFQEKDDEDIYFAPENGNVIFASAIDGWGFRIGKFAQLYSAKLGMKEVNLRRVLWGDYFLDPKTKRVISYKHLRGRSLKPLFVQFVLENIWAVYDAVITNPNPEKITKIVTALNLKIPPRNLTSKDSRSLLVLIFNQWLSLSTCIIQASIDVVPPPSQAQATRIPKMLYPDLREATITPKNKLQEDLFSAKFQRGAYISAYVSKMFAVPSKDLPGNKKKNLTADEMRAKGREAKAAAALSVGDNALIATPSSTHPSPVPPVSPVEPKEQSNENEMDQTTETLLGFARLYSGTLKQNTTVLAVLPKYNTSLPHYHPRNAKHIYPVQVEALYVMMGRELVPVEEVRAGNTFAIKGLEGKVWRSATLCAPGEDGIIIPVSPQKAESVEGAESVESAGTTVTNTIKVPTSITEIPQNIMEEIQPSLVNLGAISLAAPPIVRVALEPAKPADLPKLLDGLNLLSQSDPCVQTFQQRTGEHVILAAGELHLERCLKDLRERFARIEIHASKPIVAFRETAVRAADMAPAKTPGAPRGAIRGASAHNIVTFSVRAAPLPKSILDYILENLEILKRLQREKRRADHDNVPYAPADTDAGADIDTATAILDGGPDEEEEHNKEDIYGDVIRRPSVKPDQYWTELEKRCQRAGGEWESVVDRIWAFGPQGAGGCVLVDNRKDVQPNSLRHMLKRKARGPNKINSDEAESGKEFDTHIETGFQLATLQGPLCAEPVEAMAYFVETVAIDKEGLEKEIVQNRLPQVTGSVITSVRDACRNGLLDWSPRLMLAMYSCVIQCSTDVLGKVYGVVAKRRGRIVAEEMNEGTSFFSVSALLPVVESFGFSDDIRKRTSGSASPMLVFSGYELLDQDPFWVPTTEEELEDLGEKADRSNIAKGYVDAVRERKGMFVDRKIVEFAEKQRTLKR